MRVNIIALIAVATLATTINARVLGACYDDHDCMTCAGYSWCEKLSKCLRMWENECEEDVNMVDLIDSKNI